MNGREKLIKIMQTEGLNAKQFATEVGIQAGTISNIINGRNNASLEVMQKVLRRYENISAEWLVADRGAMYRPIGELTAPTLFDNLPAESNNPQPQVAQTATLDTVDNAAASTMPTATAPSSASTSTFVPKSAATSTQPVSASSLSSATTRNANVDHTPALLTANEQEKTFTPAKQIEKIVIFYSDGTYENFHH